METGVDSFAAVAPGPRGGKVPSAVERIENFAGRGRPVMMEQSQLLFLGTLVDADNSTSLTLVFRRCEKSDGWSLPMGSVYNYSNDHQIHGVGANGRE